MAVSASATEVASAHRHTATTEVAATDEATPACEAFMAKVAEATEAEADAEVRLNHRTTVIARVVARVSGAVRIRVEVVTVRIVTGRIGRRHDRRGDTNSEAHLRRGRSCRGNGSATSHGGADSQFCDRSHDTLSFQIGAFIKRRITHVSNIGFAGLGCINTLFIARSLHEKPSVSGLFYARIPAINFADKSANRSARGQQRRQQKQGGAD